MKLLLPKGATSQSIEVFIQDSASTTGAGKTGLAYNTSGLTAYYSRPRAVSTAITLAEQTVTGAYSSGGFVEKDATNMPGFYRFDPPDAVLATGANSASIMLKGAAGMAPLPIEVQLLDLGIAKNQALANFPFIMIDSTDHVSPKTGLTVTAQRSIDGGAFAACTNSVTEISAGVYKINLAAADLNGDTITLLFTATGADARLITIRTTA